MAKRIKKSTLPLQPAPALAAPAQAPSRLPEKIEVFLPRGFWKFLACCMSLFFPIGFVFAFLFAGNPNGRARNFGRICLALAFVGLLVQGVFWSISKFGGGAGENGDRYVQSFY